jgi:hypothetical protein
MSADPGQRHPDGVAPPGRHRKMRYTAHRRRDRGDEGGPDALLGAGQIEAGNAGGDREGGPAQQVERR